MFLIEGELVDIEIVRIIQNLMFSQKKEQFQLEQFTVDSSKVNEIIGKAKFDKDSSERICGDIWNLMYVDDSNRVMYSVIIVKDIASVLKMTFIGGIVHKNIRNLYKGET